MDTRNDQCNSGLDPLMMERIRRFEREMGDKTFADLMNEGAEPIEIDWDTVEKLRERFNANSTWGTFTEKTTINDGYSDKEHE